MRQIDVTLFRSMDKDHTEVADRLIEMGADLYTIEDNGYTLLHEAARAGHVGNMEWLVETYGFDVHAMTDYGETPIHTAAATGQVDAMMWLAEHGVNATLTNGGAVTAGDILAFEHAELAPAWDGFCDGLSCLVDIGSG